jgi:hypothetical protein
MTVVIVVEMVAFIARFNTKQCRSPGDQIFFCGGSKKVKKVYRVYEVYKTATNNTLYTLHTLYTFVVSEL